jgi:uncharacterized zinc-type alcohol dehydrogenase-like protein
MTIQTHAYIATQKGQALEKSTIQLPELAENHVRIKVTHCGLCHSDVHLMEDDLGISQYPMVPGHEVVGIVEAVGANVMHLNVGDRAGVGWISDSCGHCKQCDRDAENLCTEVEALIVVSKGGFADQVDVAGHFAYPIPEKLTSENAAPLLCAGITVYNPLKRFITEKNMTVGVVGIGGLGHLGVQFAHKMGARVVAISHSDSKKEEALAFGADVFVNSTSPENIEKVAGDIDLIIDTVSAKHDFLQLFDMLAPNGTLCVLGITDEYIKLLPVQVILSQKKVTGSAVGSPKDMIEMLDFAAEHDIQTQTELMPMSQVNEAIQRLLRNEARYRIVLEN